MSIVFLEGFDQYRNNTDAAQGWTSRWTTTSTDKYLVTGRFGTGQAMQIDHNGGEEDLFASLPTALTTLTIGFATYFGYYGTECALFRFADGMSTFHTHVNISNDGRLKLYADGASAPFLTTNPGAVRDRCWIYIEIALTISNSGAGTCQIWVEGNKVADATGLTTTGRTPAQSPGVRTIVMTESASPTIYDDMYVTDDLNPLGGIRIDNYLPNGDGAGTGWSPSNTSSTLFSMVDDTPPDTTDYIYASTVNSQQLFEVASAPVNAQSIKAVQVVCFDNKDNASFRKMAAVVSDGTNVRAGNPFIVSPTSKFDYSIFDKNALNSAWASADMTNFQFGFKITN